MFGSIFRMRPKAGQAQAVVALMDQWAKERGPKVDGSIAGYVYQPEKSPNTLIGVAVFKDRASYFKNADDPAQGQWYQQLRALLEADPEWEDGEILGGGSVR